MVHMPWLNGFKYCAININHNVIKVLTAAAARFRKLTRNINLTNKETLIETQNDGIKDQCSALTAEITK